MRTYIKSMKAMVKGFIFKEKFIKSGKMEEDKESILSYIA